ncbi:hypothetical protein [Mycobacterium sp. DBP42]|uniref:hypothetical protein n=1 Tax=Mycobacteriaceae TaxID=1762 RepID=UPI00110CBD9C|nr:hypothetical protein [Mycobacterium sp. DBP42]TMS50709.1 hypothetical protein E0T84_22760 [Mycobacterium sp. DBP42]
MTESLEALTRQVDAALGRAAHLFVGPLGNHPDLAAEIDRTRRAVEASMQEALDHRGKPTFTHWAGLHLRRLRCAAAEAQALVEQNSRR